jgi:chemotaxis protein methyltransferase CheR
LQGKWSISQECRRLVEFRPLNLVATWPMMPPCDVIFVRNVMIYFDIATRAALVERFRKLLRADGALFLGGAETLIGMDTGYDRLMGVGCSYYRPKPKR